MPVVDVVRDQTPRQIAPIDDSVVIPQSVKDAQSRAEALHAQAYPAEVDPNAPPAPVVVAPSQSTSETTVTIPPPEPVPDPVAPPPEPEPDANEPNVTSDQWRHRYLSMQGRFHASQRTIGDLQEQMTQLGNELVMTQRMVRDQTQPRPQETAPVTPVVPATKLLTQQDQEQYGEELIDFATRAARQAVAPEIDALKQENQTLKKSVVQRSQGEALGQLAAAVPNWRAVNQSAAFKQWLRQRDVYSSRVRHEMLNEAHAAANAPRMIAFFKGFLAEAQATGQTDPGTQPTAGVTPPVRQAAVPLDRLTAPGRAKPASGDTALPADKPVLTRTYIAGFYSKVRAGVFANNQREKDRLEGEIFAAQADGRVRN